MSTISDTTWHLTPRRGRVGRLVMLAAFLACAAGASAGQREVVLAGEAARIAMIERAAPSVVCVYDEHEKGGGSGVLIDSDGYGITNFHVVAGMIQTRRGFGGISEPEPYPLIVLGVDPTGDVAMFRLDGARPFPSSPLGDSDTVTLGDTAIAMGNPFVLSEDHTPSVTMGIVTGVDRYQWGEKGSLVYSRCIQIDAPINPGNSGGPLFDRLGNVVGINGRISINTRGRFNVGFGYAISSNQVARFIPGLRAGLMVAHGTLQATVGGRGDDLVFELVRPKGAADRAGILGGDRLLRIDGLPVHTSNEFASVLGTYPADWPVRVEVLRDGKCQVVDTRLDPVPVATKQPFSVDDAINREAIRRTLHRYQLGMLGSSATTTVQVSATIDRRRAGGEDDASEQYELALSGRSGGTFARVYPDGRRGRVVEFNEQTARYRLTPDGEWFDSPWGTRSVLSAMSVALGTFLSPIDELDLTGFRHAGGWAARPAGPGGEQAACHLGDESPVTPVTMFEIVEWSAGESLLARFGFAEASGRLERIEIVDLASGESGLVQLDGFAAGGAAETERHIRVSVGSEHYDDTVRHWTVVP